MVCGLRHDAKCHWHAKLVRWDASSPKNPDNPDYRYSILLAEGMIHADHTRCYRKKGVPKRVQYRIEPEVLAMRPKKFIDWCQRNISLWPGLMWNETLATSLKNWRVRELARREQEKTGVPKRMRGTYGAARQLVASVGREKLIESGTMDMHRAFFLGDADNPEIDEVSVYESCICKSCKY